MLHHPHKFYTLCILSLTLVSACSMSKLFTSDPPISITAESLTSAYGENEAAADRKYSGKLLLVTGTIQSLIVTEKGHRGIALKGTNFSRVVCPISDRQKEVFENLEEGQQITVEGECDGALAGMIVTLEDSSIK